ncbi:MAG: HAD family hydrolase [Actinomycetota bacterium]|nr:HAD family hydrolase [Actinomycetota bacterium]
MPPAAILDIDGTLVDTNFHHALAWYRAFARHDIILPMWRIHRHIGMGGDQLVGSLAGEDVEERLGDDIREAEKPLYFELIHEVQPMDGARELIEDLKERDITVVLASSAKEDEIDHYIDLVGARDIADGWTSAGDVEVTKPQPDLVNVAMEKVGVEGEAVMVGDSTWDCEAAARAEADSVGLLTGGFAVDELMDSGAKAIFESLQELRERLDWTPFAAA